MTREKRWRLRDYLTLLTCAAGLPIVGRLDQPGDVARQAHLKPAAPIDAAPSPREASVSTRVAPSFTRRRDA